MKIVYSQIVHGNVIYFNETDHLGHRCLIRVTPACLDRIENRVHPGYIHLYLYLKKTQVEQKTFLHVVESGKRDAVKQIAQWDKRHGVKAKDTVIKARRVAPKSSELSEAGKQIVAAIKTFPEKQASVFQLIEKTGLTFYVMNGHLSILKSKGYTDSKVSGDGKTKLVYLL